jgi:hypothetical protein
MAGHDGHEQNGVVGRHMGGETAPVEHFQVFVIGRPLQAIDLMLPEPLNTQDHGDDHDQGEEMRYREPLCRSFARLRDHFLRHELRDDVEAASEAGHPVGERARPASSILHQYLATLESSSGGLIHKPADAVRTARGETTERMGRASHESDSISGPRYQYVRLR